MDASEAADANCEPGTWILEPVDTDGDVGACPAIAVDLVGGIHLIYNDVGADDYDYAYRPSSGPWSVVGFDDNLDPSCRTFGMAVDSADAIHVLYRAWNGISNLTYGFKPSGGAWDLTILPSDGWESMAVDPAGGVHIAYYHYDATSPELRYASKPPGGTWDDALIEGGYVVGTTAVAVSDDGVHVTFGRQNGPNSELRHALRASTTWDVQASPYVNLGSAIAADAAGTVHGLAWNSQDVLYVRRESNGTWSTETIFERNAASDFALWELQRIAVDSDGGLHTVFPDYDRIAYSYKPTGGTWSTETVAMVDVGSGVDPIGRPSAGITLDSAGRPHIVYYDPGSKDVYYAHPCR